MGSEGAPADLAIRIARLEDRAAIQDLVVRYFLAADGDDLDALTEIFTDDATFRISGAVCGAGRDAVLAFLVAQRANMGLTVHTPNYALTTLAGEDRAQGLVGAHLELVLGGTAVYGAVRYCDEYVRIDGKWCIRDRDMRTIYLGRWNEAGQALAAAMPVQWPGIDALPSDFPRRSG